VGIAGWLDRNHHHVPFDWRQHAADAELAGHRGRHLVYEAQQNKSDGASDAGFCEQSLA
jgi:hypothetical protein